MMVTGTVKWFSPKKGYGFIAPDDNSDDVFVHIRDVERSRLDALRQGQRVQFKLVDDRRSGKSKGAYFKLIKPQHGTNL